MSEHKTHWKKLTNPDYIGAYALELGQELILTIKTVVREVVTGTDGKKEECTVAHFHENVKPMILNATNSKTIQKIYNTPYIEDWVGCKIQIFATSVKVGKEMTEALRIRPYRPEVKTDAVPNCADCSGEIASVGKFSAKSMADYTAQKYGKPLCSSCAQKRADKEKAEKIADPLADKEPDETDQGESEQNNSEQDGATE